MRKRKGEIKRESGDSENSKQIYKNMFQIRKPIKSQERERVNRPCVNSPTFSAIDTILSSLLQQVLTRWQQEAITSVRK